MEQKLKDFEVLYENDSTSNFLVLRADCTKTIINYQVQMLLNNKFNGLLKFNLNFIGIETNCYYDVTSKCTLAGFMARKQFTRDEFLITILNVINNIYQLKNYLLYDNNILLDENYIYVEPENTAIYFVYIPFNNCSNDIRAFFLKLIFRLIKFHDEYSDNYFQKILEVIKKDSFYLGDLKLLIENLLGDALRNKDDANMPELPDVSNTEHYKADFAAKEKSSIKSAKLEERKYRDKLPNIKIPNSIISKKQNIKSDKNEECCDGSIITDRNSKLLFGSKLLLQPIILVLFIFIVNSNFVKMSENSINTVIVLILIFILADILVIRILNEKSRKPDTSNHFMQIKFLTKMMKNSTETSADEITSKDIFKEDCVLHDINQYKGETEVIKSPKRCGIPYLKEKDGEEVVEINKKSILIGRMESFVDCIISSNAIGKIHAEILQEGEEFYVMDCNSRNGTFINDNRIIPNTKNRLINNNLLRFANKEYIFINAYDNQ